MVTPSRKQELLNGLLALLQSKRPPEIPMTSVISGGDFGDQGEKLEELRRREAQKAQRADIDDQIERLNEKALPLGPATTVGIGALVTCRYPHDGKVQTMFILPVAGGEILSNGTCIVMTPTTPLGKALGGCTQGDIVKAKTPAGLRTIEIISVE